MTSRPARPTARGNGKTKSSRKRQNSHRESFGTPRASAEDSTVAYLPAKKDTTPVKAKTPNQALYISSIKKNVLTVAQGTFGVGKTYLAVKVGCEMFIEGKVERMIFSRPALGAEEELGFFTGDINEKYANWVKPIREVLDKTLGASHVEFLVKRDIISFQPFATMRGHTWAKTFIMLDEGQNTTPNQMKMFLSRAGEESRIVINGDPHGQKDHKEWSGIEDALEVLEGSPDVGIVHFTIDDIVRSGFVKNLAIAYHNRDKRKAGKPVYESATQGLRRTLG